ncbi:ArsR/SmtB family transcription factor [Yinghuangia seranimata]|uniref:ArsR/SmtB family transcription factor n=1 Tax=Yinghuangia seranimata TaxID=408067 RepID=UPI00248B401A|nr:ArsR family transcriptional regulator [Yinghuangia seranimata]MDI2127619.1 ArsR family transcriptional regulator [Yinghuangia seranimata]
MVELVLAIAMLQRSDAVFGLWRRRMGQTLTRTAGPLLEVVPATAKGPLFLDPPNPGFEDGLDHVLSTPTALVRSELRRVHAPDRRPGLWTRQLVDRDRDAWRSLERAVRTAHARVIGGSWDRIRAGFDAERAWRTQLLAGHGIRAMLAGLTPTARWREMTLEFDSTDDVEITLGGAGVTLLPSVFWTGRPLLGRYDQSSFLVYPAVTPLPLIDEPSTADALAMLLGRTRATVLEQLIRPRTSTDLVRDLGLAKSSVSEHTKALRAARLITAQRDGKAVWHSCTPLGLGLLTGVTPVAAPTPGGGL